MPVSEKDGQKVTYGDLSHNSLITKQLNQQTFKATTYKAIIHCHYAHLTSPLRPFDVATTSLWHRHYTHLASPLRPFHVTPTPFSQQFYCLFALSTLLFRALPTHPSSTFTAVANVKFTIIMLTHRMSYIHVK